MSAPIPTTSEAPPRPVQTGAADPGDAPIDILKIEPDLVGIATSPDRENRLRDLLIFLGKLTNARACVLVDPAAEVGSQVLGRIWKESSALGPPEIAEIVATLKPAGERASAVVRVLERVPGFFLVASPITRAGQHPLFVGLVLAATHPRQLEPFLIILQTASGFLHTVLGPKEERREWALQQATALVELGSLPAKSDDFATLSRLLADNLRRHLNCVLVALGHVKGSSVRLESISGAGPFDQRGETVSSLRAAMIEARNSTDLIVCEPAAGSSNAGLTNVAHRELARVMNWATVATLPLLAPDGSVRDVLTLCWDEPGQMSPERRQFLQAAAPYFAIQVRVWNDAAPPAPVRWWRRIPGKTAGAKRLFLIGALGALAIIMACPFPNYMWVNCQVQPVVKRVVAAPFEGTLKEAKIEPGEIVKEGTTLAVMDDKELRWKEAELHAARDRALTLSSKNLMDPESDHALSLMAQLEASQHDLDLKVVEHKIANLEIKAPVEGVVLAGDLKRAAGVPVTKGQALFEVAPLNALVLEIEVPDSDVAYVKVGMDVTARLEAFPGETWKMKLKKINPQSDIRDGANVFVAEADLAPSPVTSELRPGMKGRVVITGASQPLFWLLTHRAWEYLRLLLFW